jgi:hypothetical protein
MKIGKMIYAIMIISMLTLYACGGGGGGGDTTPNQTPEVTVQFLLSVSTSGNGSVDHPESKLYDKDSSVQLTATPSEGYIFDHWEGDATGGDKTISITMDGNKTVMAIFVLAVVANITQAQVEDVIYAAFAVSANETYIEIPMYEVLVNGFMKICTQLILDNMKDEVITQLFLTRKYTITTAEYVAKITLSSLNLLTLIKSFEGSLAIDIKDKGLITDSCIFKGTRSGDEINITFNGYIMKDSSFYLRTVNINAFNQLEAFYNNKTVKYNNWNLAMEIFYGSEDPYFGKQDLFTNKNVNMSETINNSFLTGDMSNDIKDYTVGGVFTINDGKYTFNPGFRYQKKLNNAKDLLLTSANGKIGVPGMTGVATVTSSSNFTNPTDNKTISSTKFDSTTWSHNWVSGQMTISSLSSIITADFDNGKFSSGALGDWPLDDNWQLADPLN